MGKKVKAWLINCLNWSKTDFIQTARQLGLDGIVREGVYTMVGGPNYETVAELKMLRELGNILTNGRSANY